MGLTKCVTLKSTGPTFFFTSLESPAHSQLTKTPDVFLQKLCQGCAPSQSDAWCEVQSSPTPPRPTTTRAPSHISNLPLVTALLSLSKV